MPFDPSPSAWIPGYAVSGSEAKFPFASLTGVTAGEAAPGSTGDVRRLLRGLYDAFYLEWASLATADRPTQMTLNRSTSRNETTGIISETYTARFNTQIVDSEVVDE